MNTDFNIYESLPIGTNFVILHNYWMLAINHDRIHICNPDRTSIFYQYGDSRVGNSFGGHLGTEHQKRNPKETNRGLRIYNKDLNKSSRDLFTITRFFDNLDFASNIPLAHIASKINFDMDKLNETTSSVEYKPHSQIIQAFLLLSQISGTESFGFSQLYEKALELQITFFGLPLEELIRAGQLNKTNNIISASPILKAQLMLTINRIRKEEIFTFS